MQYNKLYGRKRIDTAMVQYGVTGLRVWVHRRDEFGNKDAVYYEGYDKAHRGVRLVTALRRQERP